jgi:general secretion pathway protein G
MLVRNQSNRQRRAAFTLMEMLVVVAIIVALAGIGGFFLLGQFTQSQEDVASAQVRGPLTQACQSYFLKHSQYPPDLRELLKEDGMGGPYLESVDALRDPWGQEYKYSVQSQHGQRKPDIWTTPPSNSQKLIGNWPKGQ